jgi:6-phosphogluconate dehydrogenase
MLEKMHAALMENPGKIQSVMLLPSIASQLQETHMSWRRIVTLCFASAIPCPCLGASLTYYDSYRSERLSSSLIRAQRDFFGGYGYDRFNEEGWYTSCWVQEHTDGLKRTTKKLENGANDDTKKKKRKTK